MSTDRRTFLAAVTSGLAALPFSNVMAMGAPLSRRRGPQDKVVIVNMLGGWDILNVIAPYGTNEYGNRRPDIALPAPDPANPDALLPLEPGLGLHPGLAPLHPLWAQGQFMVVQKVGYPSPSLSHFTSQDIYSRGQRDLTDPDSRGWLGRLGDSYFQTSLQIVGLRTGNKTDFRANVAPPVAIDDLASFTVPGNTYDPGDSELRNSITRQILDNSGSLTGLRAQARDSVRSVFDLVDQVGSAVQNYSSTVTYPGSGLGRSLQDVARLIQGQLPTQVFYVQRGGFDTHSGQVGSMENSVADVGNSLGAFIQDVQAMSEWSNTTLIVISEFGRRNFQNGSFGTDHGHGLHFLLLGGSLQGGLRGNAVTDTDLLLNYLPMEVDFRQIYSEVLQSRFGVDPTPLFPGWTHPGGSLNLF